MNALTPYAAFFMRSQWAACPAARCEASIQRGIPATAAFLHDVGFPFAIVFAVILIAVETIGAACVRARIFTRFWALCNGPGDDHRDSRREAAARGNIELEACCSLGDYASRARGRAAVDCSKTEAQQLTSNGRVSRSDCRLFVRVGDPPFVR